MSNEAKKYILFSPIGDHDPINTKNYSEGSMLHIVRHYKPEVVILYLTAQMQKKDEKDNRYEISIKKINKDCKIEKIKAEVEDPHNFDRFIDEFSKIIEQINKKYPDYEILLNISSGTPQIKSNLVLETVTSSIKLIPVQVETPLRASNTQQDDFKIEFLDKIDTKKEQENNRCFVPKVLSFKYANLSSQIKSLIDNYEYNAAINLLEKSNIKNEFDGNIIKLLKHCFYRLNLDFEKAQQSYDLEIENKLFEYFYTIKIKQKKNELADFALKITPILTELVADFTDKKVPIAEISYEKVKGKKKIQYIGRELIQEYDSKYKTEILAFLDKIMPEGIQYNDQFKNFTTLISICKYFRKEYGNDISKEAQEYNKIVGLFLSFEKFEQMIRNTTAHEMVGINEIMIKEYSGFSSKVLLSNLEKILIKEKQFVYGRLVYDEINEQLKTLL